ncbi:NAD-dependent epimerase/dehydratase family protein [Chitinophaga sancti]|uniref:NAD-dependent epimerase/dehydratase family protein n=1 Tax=Chitinophaga sancti TaxID=1004 RepID=UPI003F78B15D
MKVFITGINGYIGGTIANLLINKGYEVTGLVRRPELLAPLSAMGIEAIAGTIDNATLLQSAAVAADAVIHTASHIDPYSLEVLLHTLKGTGKTLIHTSGSSILGRKEYGAASSFIYTEDDPLLPRIERIAWTAINNHVLQAATTGIRTIVIIPTMVYGIGRGLHKESIQLPLLWKIAREKGQGIYVEKGESIWSNVHVADLAELYLKALENAPAGSAFYAENGEASFKQIAAAMSAKLGVSQTLSLSMDEAIGIFGPDMSHYGLASNSRASSEKARRILGWQPSINGIFDHIKNEIS